MKRTLALICVLTLAGCSTTPEHNAAIVDAIQGAASNFNAAAQTVPIAEPASNAPPQVITNAPPSSPFDALDISKARTISKYVRNVPAMPITVRLFNVNTSADRVTFDYTTTGWKSDGTIDGRIAIIWQDGAELIVGEFDGKRPNQRMKGLENIHGGYIQGKQPAKGAPVWYVIYDKTGTQRSNVAAGGVWK
jgi:membrane-associated protease RseP (regulator of RpoE activity)